MALQRGERAWRHHRQFSGLQMRQIDQGLEIGIPRNAREFRRMVMQWHDGPPKRGARRFRIMCENETMSRNHNESVHS